MSARPRSARFWSLGAVLVGCALASGCGTWFNRTAYDTLTNYQHQRSPCVAPVPSDCPKTPTYDQYRRERDAARSANSDDGPADNRATDSP